LSLVLAMPPAATDQAMAIKHCMHRANRRRLDVVMQSTQFLANLRGTPARVLAP